MSDETPESLVPQEVAAADPVINRDGSVRKKPGPKPGTPRRVGKAKAPAPGQRAPSVPKKPSTGVDYRPAILGIAQIPQLLCALAAKFVKSAETKTALILDGMTVGVHAPNVANALNTTAQDDDKLAKILDKLTVVGPYSLVITALMVPVGQVLANHGVIAPNAEMGILDPDTLVALAQSSAG